jgi:hypothetical protein
MNNEDAFQKVQKEINPLKAVKGRRKYSVSHLRRPSQEKDFQNRIIQEILDQPLDSGYATP